jgi:hypothetical protein
MKKLCFIIIAITLYLVNSRGITGQTKTVSQNWLKAYEHSHDLDLPDWGPYSKKYNGLSHITSKTDGYRFDLSFAAGYFHRSKMVLPDVTQERDYFIWDVDKDLKYLSYKYQLEWKNQVVCDVVFSEIDDQSRFMTVQFSNNTATAEDVVYNLLASMNYPSQKNGRPILKTLTDCPDDCIWIDGMDYTELNYGSPRYDDNLIYDAFRKGEEYGSGMVNAHALGQDFGKGVGDEVRYSKVNFKGNALLLRYKTNGDSPITLSLNNQQTIVLKPSKSFTTQLIHISPGVKNENQLMFQSPGNECGWILDGMFTGPEESLRKVAFWEEPYHIVPEQIPGPVNNSLLLKYKNTDLYYGILWEGPEHYKVEIYSDKLDQLPAYNNRNIDVPIRHENDKGHFTNILVHGIEVMPFSSTTLNGIVCSGTKEKVIRQLSDFKSQKEKWSNKQKTLFDTRFAESSNDKYGFAMRRMNAVTLNNLVFPIYCEDEYIRHYTPGRRWNSLYTWDLGIIGIGMAELDIQRSINILNTYTNHPSNPNAFVHHGTPAPTQIYQYLEIWNKTNDVEFLKHYYPRLKRYYQFIAGLEGSSITRLPSGLTKTWDYFYNSAGWDDYPPQRWVEANDPDHLICPAVSASHVIRSAKILKMAAQQLGLKDDMKAYNKDIQQTTNALQRYSWDDPSGYFSYVVHNKQGEVTGILRSENGDNMNMGMDGAMPLVAGACTPEQRELLLKKLTDKTRLWTNVGISVDQQAPHANVNAYTNETVWIAHQWFFWKTFLDLGMGQEAWELAQTALDVFSRETNRTYHCWEHYTEKSGLGTGWHQFSGLNAPLINWYNIYFKPGKLYGGFDCWVTKQYFTPDITGAHIEFQLFEQDRSASKTLLVSLRKGNRYRAQLNGQALAFKTITPGTLQFEIPTGMKQYELIIEKQNDFNNLQPTLSN